MPEMRIYFVCHTLKHDYAGVRFGNKTCECPKSMAWIQM